MLGLPNLHIQSRFFRGTDLQRRGISNLELLYLPSHETFCQEPSGWPPIKLSIWRAARLLGLVDSVVAVPRHLDSHRADRRAAKDESAKRFPELGAAGIVGAC